MGIGGHKLKPPLIPQVTLIDTCPNGTNACTGMFSDAAKNTCQDHGAVAEDGRFCVLNGRWTSVPLTAPGSADLCTKTMKGTWIANKPADDTGYCAIAYREQ